MDGFAGAPRDGKGHSRTIDLGGALRRHSPEPGQRHDLRLVFPAVAAWVTALIILGTSPAVALTFAAAAAVSGAVLRFGGRRTAWRTVAAGALV